jgi:hypothetical protein
MRALKRLCFFGTGNLVQNKTMIYGYARVSIDGQSVAADLRKHGAGKVFREVASGSKTEHAPSFAASSTNSTLAMC